MKNRFLLELPQRNYPEEYFISRIRGGRSRLIRDWDMLLYSTDPRGFLKEFHYDLDSSFIKPLLKRYRWLYSEMNDRLREAFWPYFLLYELKTLIICLRYIKRGHNEDAEELLRVSLLSGQIREIILFPDDFDTTIRRLLDFLAEGYEGLLDGYEIFHRKGLSGFERFIYEIFLKYLLSLDLQRHIKRFIIYQIDMRNILSLYKSIKWEIITPPEFLSGGELNLRELERILIQRDLNLFSSILKRLTGLSGENIEDILLKGLSFRLKKWSYEDNIGLILHYLWSLYIELRNLGTILSAGTIERAELKEEIL